MHERYNINNGHKRYVSHLMFAHKGIFHSVMMYNASTKAPKIEGAEFDQIISGVVFK